MRRLLDERRSKFQTSEGSFERYSIVDLSKSLRHHPSEGISLTGSHKKVSELSNK